MARLNVLLDCYMHLPKRTESGKFHLVYNAEALNEKTKYFYIGNAVNGTCMLAIWFDSNVTINLGAC